MATIWMELSPDGTYLLKLNTPFFFRSVCLPSTVTLRTLESSETFPLMTVVSSFTVIKEAMSIDGGVMSFAGAREMVGFDCPGDD